VKRQLLYWWLLNVITIAVIYIIHDFGVLTQLYTNDKTFITYLITTLLIMSTISVGAKYWQSTITGFEADYRKEEYVSSIAITLGMIGTIIGFMIMLSGSLGNIEINDVQSVKRLLSGLTQGLFTALNTTLLGLITSLHLRTQFVILGADDHED